MKFVQRDSQNQNRLIFLHIPKTAGSTTHFILNKKYKQGEVQNVSGSRMGDPEIRAFTLLSERKRSRIKLLKGHMPFGLHKYLPGESRYFCFLRHPVDRVCSLYNYILREKPPGHGKNKFYDFIVRNKMSVGDFVRSGEALGVNNGQLRFLIAGFESIPFGGTSEDSLKQAYKNIDQLFLTVGITDHFDLSMLILFKEMGWAGKPYYWHHNKRRRRTEEASKLPEICRRDIDTIMEYNDLDLQLYEKFKSRLIEKASSERGLEQALQKFRTLNSGYQIVTRPLTPFFR